MKNLLTFIFLVLTTVVSATNYYISPNGNDSNSGTIDSPFFTLNKAWSVVQAGDIIYVRGGVYRFSSRQTLSGKSGTSSNMIKIWAYPGEKPVFTKSSSFTTPSWPVSLVYLSNSNYVHVKGLTITGFTQATATIWYGMALTGSNHNILEMINSNHNGHGMVIRDESGDNLVLNCDFHHNFDPLTSGDAYGNADGLEVGYQSSSIRNTVRGCRIWNNSDDGIDLWYNNGSVTIDGCWAWSNGYREDGSTKGGDGNGFKLGSTTTEDGSSFKRDLRNNLAVYNRASGFNQNGADVKVYMYNNTSYKNLRFGADFYSYNVANIIRNIIVSSNSAGGWNGDFSNSTKDHNSYDGSFSPNGPSVSSSDFMSVDTTGMSGPRAADGSLPSINYMKLATGSRLIDAGIDVGIPYNGSAPDLGTFESGYSNVAPTVSYVGAEVKDASPSVISVNFSKTLANVVPVASSFSVTVNSTSAAVSGVSISGSSVLLTLSNPIKYGNVVTFSYTKPSTNPLQTTDGAYPDNLSNKPVVNSIAAPAIPVYVSSAIANAAPSQIVMTYNMDLANIIPANSAFVPKVNRIASPVNSVSISGSNVTLTIQATLKSTDTVTISYIKPSVNPLQTPAAGMAASLTDQSVVNNITPVATATPPVYVGSVVENTATNQIVMTYNMDLAGIVPATSAFVPKINRMTSQVNAVSVSGRKVTLTLPAALKSSDTITISYIKPSVNPLQTPAGGIATTVLDQKVTNNIQPGSTDVAPTIGNISITPKQVTSSVSILNFSPGSQIFYLRFFDFAGNMHQEIKIDSTTNLSLIPVSLSKGIYISKLMQGTTVDYIQKIIVVSK
jgi:uncharacterized repeat protein (TIGR02059 family)